MGVTVADTLEHARIFADVDRGQLAALAKHAQEIEVAAGADLTHEGRYEGFVYIVVSGMVAVIRDGRTVDTIGPGDIVGEIAAIDGGPRTATARAIDDSRLIVISQVHFNDALDASPELREIVMRSMEGRLARIDAES